MIPQLEDITETAGIHFTHSSALESRHIVESMSGGALLLDYDRDGRPDIYLTCGGDNVLFHNNGEGTFTDVPAKAGVSDGGRIRTEIETLEIRWPSGAIDTVTSFVLYSKEKELYLPSKSGHWRKGDLICESGTQSSTRGRESWDFGMEQ